MTESPPDILNTCCADSPWLNLSSEAPDRDRNFGTVNFVQRPPLGYTYYQVGCQRSCVSEVSQDAADDCALAQAASCLYNNWVPPTPPGEPQQPPVLYSNDAQTCTVRCSDGQQSAPGVNTFTWVVPRGTVVALSQAEANTLAKGRACQLARRNIICINSTLAGGCKDQAYKQRVFVTGGTPAIWPFLNFTMPAGCAADVLAGDRTTFSPIPYTFSLISGALPPGLELRPCTGYIKGTPTASGEYTFTVKATDAIGSFQVHTFTIAIVNITTPTALPDAFIGQAYAEALDQTGGDIVTEVWALKAGSTLPPGLTLAANGLISGTPTDFTPQSYSFTIKVTTE